MKNYLDQTKDYYEKGYEAENVESFVFRTYGRILKPELGLIGTRHEKILDFGCGQGAALRFFKTKGFDVHGVDIIEKEIRRCRELMPDIQDQFAVIPPVPSESEIFFGGGFDLVIAIQSLYFYCETDLQTRLASLHRQMKPGAILFATMMGTQHYWYRHSSPHRDGVRKVEVDLPRVKLKDFFVNFTHSEKNLVEKFGLFEKVHVGYYDACYHEEEGSTFHYTFMGRKSPA